MDTANQSPICPNESFGLKRIPRKRERESFDQIQINGSQHIRKDPPKLNHTGPVLPRVPQRRSISLFQVRTTLYIPSIFLSEPHRKESEETRIKGERKFDWFNSRWRSKMSWQSYIDDQLMYEVDGQHLKAAAIVGNDGSVWAQSSEFPQVFLYCLIKFSCGMEYFYFYSFIFYQFHAILGFFPPSFSCCRRYDLIGSTIFCVGYNERRICRKSTICIACYYGLVEIWELWPSIFFKDFSIALLRYRKCLLLYSRILTWQWAYARAWIGKWINC